MCHHHTGIWTEGKTWINCYYKRWINHSIYICYKYVTLHQTRNNWESVEILLKGTYSLNQENNQPLLGDNLIRYKFNPYFFQWGVLQIPWGWKEGTVIINRWVWIGFNIQLSCFLHIWYIPKPLERTRHIFVEEEATARWKIGKLGKYLWGADFTLLPEFSWLKNYLN